MRLSKLIVIFIFCFYNLTFTQIFNNKIGLNTTISNKDIIDSSYNDDLSSNIEDYKSPSGAMLRSAILPGWGQLYNESYWKIPIIGGIITGLVYYWIKYNNQYINFKDLYNESIKNNSPNNNYKLSRDFYRDERDLYAIYLGLTYFLNIVDAYVDAHLFGFNLDLIDKTIKINLKYKL